MLADPVAKRRRGLFFRLLVLRVFRLVALLARRATFRRRQLLGARWRDLGWMFVASAEMMGASNGLGFVLTNGEQIGRPDQVIAAILVFAVCGKTTDWILARVASALTSWQDTVRRGEPA